MSKPSLILWVDQSNNTLLSDWQSLSSASSPTFKQGDTVGVELHILNRNVNSANIVEEVPFGSATVRMAVGNPDASPSAGTWKLTYGSDTMEFSYAESASAIQTALNALSTIYASGGVSVLKINNHTYRISFNSVGTTMGFTADPSALIPASLVQISQIKVGSVSQRSVFQVKLKQQPVAFQSTWTSQSLASISSAVIQSNVTRISISPSPKGGTFTLTVNGDSTKALNYNATALEVGSAVNELLEDTTTFEVVKSSSYQWDISNTTSTSYTIGVDNGAGLISFDSKFGLLNFNNYEVENLLNGSPSVSTTLEIEITRDGNITTVYQGRCVINAQLMESTVYEPIPYQQAVTEAPTDGEIYGRRNASWTVITDQIGLPLAGGGTITGFIPQTGTPTGAITGVINDWENPQTLGGYKLYYDGVSGNNSSSFNDGSWSLTGAEVYGQTAMSDSGWSWKLNQGKVAGQGTIGDLSRAWEFGENGIKFASDGTIQTTAGLPLTGGTLTGTVSVVDHTNNANYIQIANQSLDIYKSGIGNVLELADWGLGVADTNGGSGGNVSEVTPSAIWVQNHNVGVVAMSTLTANSLNINDDEIDTNATLKNQNGSSSLTLQGRLSSGDPMVQSVLSHTGLTFTANIDGSTEDPPIQSYTRTTTISNEGSISFNGTNDLNDHFFTLNQGGVNGASGGDEYWGLGMSGVGTSGNGNYDNWSLNSLGVTGLPNGGYDNWQLSKWGVHGNTDNGEHWELDYNGLSINNTDGSPSDFTVALNKSKVSGHIDGYINESEVTIPAKDWEFGVDGAKFVDGTIQTTAGLPLLGGTVTGQTIFNLGGIGEFDNFQVKHISSDWRFFVSPYETYMFLGNGNGNQIRYENDEFSVKSGTNLLSFGSYGIKFNDNTNQTTAWTGYTGTTSQYIRGNGSLATFPTIPSISGLLVASNNLSDLTNSTTARTNLGLGSMATATATDYLAKSGNLSGLASSSTARTNLGLGTMATETASNYLTTANASSTYLTQSNATTTYYPLGSNPSGYLTASALTPYLTSATASTTYYPLSSNPSGYLTSSALTPYAPLAGATFTGKVNISAGATTSPLNIGAGISPSGAGTAGDIWIGNTNLAYKDSTNVTRTTVTTSQSNTFTNFQTITQGNASNPSLAVTQTGAGGGVLVTNTGAGYSFKVEDSASPDATPFAIDQNGRTGIGVAPDATVALTLDSTGIKVNGATLVPASAVTNSPITSGNMSHSEYTKELLITINGVNYAIVLRAV